MYWTFNPVAKGTHAQSSTPGCDRIKLSTVFQNRFESTPVQAHHCLSCLHHGVYVHTIVAYAYLALMVILGILPTKISIYIWGQK